MDNSEIENSQKTLLWRGHHIFVSFASRCSSTHQRKIPLGVPLWPSGSGQCCGKGSIPGLGTSTLHAAGAAKGKKKKKEKEERKEIPLVLLAWGRENERF